MQDQRGYRPGPPTLLCLIVATIFVLPFLNSCGERATTPTTIPAGTSVIGAAVTASRAATQRAGTATTLSSSAQPSPISVSPLAAILQARSLAIRDDWSGLALSAPHVAHYSLRRTDAGFVGEASFAVGGYSGVTKTATRQIEIPLAAMDAFLHTLAVAPLRPGAYTPWIEHTDDYPDRSIDVETDSGTISFASKSQGDGNAPWGAQVGGRAYTVATTEPADALASIGQYLQRGVLRELETSVLTDLQATAVARPTPVPLLCRTPTPAVGGPIATAVAIRTPGPATRRITDPAAPIQTGDAVNLVQRLGLTGSQPIRVTDRTDDKVRIVTDAARIAAIEASLDQFVLVVPPPSAAGLAPTNVIEIEFRTAQNGYVSLLYRPAAEIIEFVGASTSAHVIVQAPPGLRSLLVQQECGR